MSLLLGMAFAALGFLALAAILSSIRHSAPLVAALRGDLRQPVPVEELRLTMQDAVLPEADSAPAHQYPLHQPKPIARLLQARERVLRYA